MFRGIIVRVEQTDVCKETLTVVRIHMRAATLAPMAAAPAAPPRTALADALLMISRKDNCSSALLAVLLDAVVVVVATDMM